MKQICILVLAMLLTACKPAPESQIAFDSGGSAYTAALSRDGSMALFSNDNDNLQLWSTASGQPRYRWTLDGENQVLSAAFADDDSVVVTAEANRFAIWDLANGENIGFYTIDDSPIRDIAVSNGGRQVLIGQANGNATHIDLESGRRIVFVGHQHAENNIDSAVTSVALSANGRYCLTGGNDGNAFLWDSNSGQVVHAFRNGSSVLKVALDRLGRYALVGDNRNHAVIWDLRTGLAVSELVSERRQLIFATARFSDDGQQLATGSPGRQLVRWSVTSGQKLAEYQVATRGEHRPDGAVVLGVAFASDNSLWSVSSSGYAEHWPTTTTQ